MVRRESAHAIIAILAVLMVATSCGGDATEDPTPGTTLPTSQATTTVATTTPPTSLATTTTAAITTTTAAITTTTAPHVAVPSDLDPAAHFESFLTQAIDGDVEAALASVEPGRFDGWQISPLTNFIQFVEAVGGPTVFSVADCSIVRSLSEADGGGVEVACYVTARIISDAAIDVIAMNLSAETTAIARTGILTQIDPPSHSILRAVVDHGVTAGDQDVDPTCSERSGEVKNIDPVAFHAPCGVWIAAHAADYEDAVVATTVESIADQYAVSCAWCHGQDLGGGREYSLIDSVAINLSDDVKRKHIAEGGSTMPAFDRLSAEEIESLIIFIRDAQAAGS